jgi:hypothetical protein
MISSGSITKRLDDFDRVTMAAIGAVNFFIYLGLNISPTPPTFTAIAAKMVKKF